MKHLQHSLVVRVLLRDKPHLELHDAWTDDLVPVRAACDVALPVERHVVRQLTRFFSDLHRPCHLAAETRHNFVRALVAERGGRMPTRCVDDSCHEVCDAASN